MCEVALLHLLQSRRRASGRLRYRYVLREAMCDVDELARALYHRAEAARQQYRAWHLMRISRMVWRSSMSAAWLGRRPRLGRAKPDSVRGRRVMASARFWRCHEAVMAIMRIALKLKAPASPWRH